MVLHLTKSEELSPHRVFIGALGAFRLKYTEIWSYSITGQLLMSYFSPYLVVGRFMACLKPASYPLA